MTHALVFGPIVSRRFGRSLGINTMARKHCSYSCVYCQVGSTPRTSIERVSLVSPSAVAAAVQERLIACAARGETIDYLSFVPDGEPTLDLDLGASIAAVKRFGIPVAVLTNGSLLWGRQVRSELGAADVVSIEIDTVDDETWRRIDRPPASLQLPAVLGGMRQFAREFRGALWTQTMLLRNVNDDSAAVDAIAGFVAEIHPGRAFLAVPTRPPADSRATPPDATTLLRAAAVFAARVPNVELLAHIAEDGFAARLTSASQLVDALAVHPMPEEVVRRAGGTEVGADELLAEGTLQRIEYAGTVFLARR